MSGPVKVKTLRMMMMTDDDDEEMTEIIEDFSPLRNSTKGNRKLTRAEKSRLAAKRRRDNESAELDKLIDLLPFSSESLKRIDKNSLMDLLLDYMKMKHYIQKEMAALSIKDAGDESEEKTKQVTLPTTSPTTKPSTSDNGQNAVSLIDGMEIEESTLMLEAMNGFLILLDKKKRIMYVSDGVLTHLGMDQIHMLGKHIKDFIHPEDMAELRKQFNMKACGEKENCNCTPIVTGRALSDDLNEPPHLDNARVFYLRMKFYIRRKNARRKLGGYNLVQWSGRLKMRSSSQPGGYAVDGMICICRPMQTNSVLEINLDGNMFMSRHDMGMRFTFCDPRIVTLLGYEPQELLGKTAYTFHNPIDAPKVSNCHSNLILKGASVSKYYRFIGKNTDWVWMQTRATVIYNTSNVPQYIVCMNYIISQEEGERYLMGERDNMIKAHLAAVECGAMEDHHSDSGYGSSASPYSSIHQSPCSDHGNGNTDSHKDSQSQQGRFPTNVFQEAANTVNGNLGTEDEVIQMLKNFDQQMNSNLNTTMHNNCPVSKPVTTTSSLQFNPRQRKISAGTPVFQLSGVPCDLVGSQARVGGMRRNASTGDIQHIPQRLLSNGMQQARVASVQHLSEQGRISEIDSLYSPDQHILSPEVNMMSPPHTISDDSSEPMDLISQETLASAMISDVNLVQQGVQSPESTCSQSSIPSSGLMNVQVGVLNTMDLDTIGDDLPKEIADFCFEYCNSLADNQAQQLLSTYGQGDLTELGQVNSQINMGNEKSFSDQQMNQSFTTPGSLSFASPPQCTAPANTAAGTEASRDHQIQQCSFPVSSSEMNVGQFNSDNLPSNYPLVPNASLVAPVNGVVNAQSAEPVPAQSPGSPQQAMQNCWKEAHKAMGNQSLLKNFLVPETGSLLHTGPGSMYSQASPQSCGSILSPCSSMAFSPSHPPPQSPNIYQQSPMTYMAHSSTTTCIPPTPNGISQNVYPRSQYCKRQSASCSNGTVTQTRTLLNSAGFCNQINKTCSAQSAMVSHSANGINSHNNCCSSVSKAGSKDKMSELEKMLRGYSSRPNGVPISTISGCSDQASVQHMSDLNRNGHPTLLQQMLTGQLSGEVYHAMENKRKMTSTVKPLQ